MINNIEQKKKIYFNFTYYALKLLGKNLYSNPWTAISEIVANGLDAGAPKIYVLLDITNKKESHIEILDTGCGMSNEDLQEKYTLIGRNKRLSEVNIDANKVFGRKGIGKLAALYLSPVYYLATKTVNSNSIWEVDTRKYKDDDRPSLDAVSDRTFLLDYLWKKQSTGTLIELTKVDLSRIGEEKIKSLSSILADYYMLDNMKSKIYVAVIDNNRRDIKFKLAKKNTFFDTMYAIWDNTNKNFYKRLKEKIYLTKENNVPKEIDYPRKTEVINNDYINNLTKGRLSLKNNEGEIVTKEYSLVGWIGIQGSLDSEQQKRNNPTYKKQLFRGNSLRLYVRGKLAVEDIMTYLKNTQAFASYIEGEINFDILDDNDLEDISTSNREGYLISDLRVQKLLSILKEIVGSLIRKRVKIGNDINEEIKTYNIKLLEEEQRRKQLAIDAQNKAEKKAAEERAARRRAEQDAENRSKQVYFLQKQINEDETVQAYNTHVIKNNAGRISDNILILLKNHPETKEYNEIRSISLASKKILSAVNYFNSVNYDFVIKNMDGNLAEFIYEYIDNVIKKEFHELRIQLGQVLDYFCHFPPQDVTVAIENIFSNALKAKAKSVFINFEKNDNAMIIKFTNDGKKLPNVDKDKLFEFGYSYQDSETSAVGTGVGLYQIKDCFERKISGRVDIYNNDERGVTLEIKLNENKL